MPPHLEQSLHWHASLRNDVVVHAAHAGRGGEHDRRDALLERRQRQLGTLCLRTRARGCTVRASGAVRSEAVLAEGC